MAHNSKMNDFIRTVNIIVGMNVVSREDVIKQLSNILQKIIENICVKLGSRNGDLRRK